MASFCFAQADLKVVGSGVPFASASQVDGTTGVDHHTH
jgi:hypothetical protein